MLRKSCIAAAVAALGFVSAAQAAPFPANGVYEQNFDAALGAEWNLDDWVRATPASGGRATMTGTGSGNGLINGTEPAGVSYPLDPVKPAQSLSSFGFAGNWLVNAAATGTPLVGIATLTLTDLPAHTSIDLDMLLAGGDSVDTADTNFIIRVDGVQVLNWRPGGSGVPGGAGNGTVSFATNGNLTSFYREQWNANAQTANDRTGTSWTLDSAHDLGNLSSLNSIAHTGDTLTIEFEHGLSSAASDEFVGIDNLKVTLVPEPAALGLGTVALLGLLGRRRRR